jgi:hypothetical protein
LLAAFLLEVAVGYFHEPVGSFLYIVAKGGEAVLLIADCLIAIFFVTRGIKNAWNATWGASS